MSDSLRLTILGCGASAGTPRVTGDWGACDPTNPKNRRLRCSALVERVSPAGTTTVVIDCGPDFHQQMVRAGVGRLDGVVVTHPHADHIHGVDDLRGFFLDDRRRVDLFCDDETFERMFKAFGYCFQSPPGSSYPPIVNRVRIAAGTGFEIDGPGGAIRFEPFRQVHGSIHSLGFRIGSLAYCSDVSDFPEAAQDSVREAAVMIVDALQYRTHPSHFSLGEALEWIDRLKVDEAVLTHMHTALDYETMCRELPEHVRPAFDGMVLELPYA